MAEVTEIFPDYASALAACGESYNAPDIAEVVAYKTAQPLDRWQILSEQAMNTIAAVAVAAAEVSGRPLRVLDFGGGCGFHYLHASATLAFPLQWAIVETPLMAKAATKLAANRFTVFTDIASAASALQSVDLVHVSGALQYTSDPLATLRELAALQPLHLALLRFPMWPHGTKSGVQVSLLDQQGLGPMPPHIQNRKVKYPVTFTKFDDVGLVIKEDYGLLYVTDSLSGHYGVVGEKIVGRNLVFRRRR
jgi:putative methyltransferase (TIGR04325 family)